jgi:catechol 2,3-dioxygenase-like lactoylglutathione lyase family enzyme
MPPTPIVQPTLHHVNLKTHRLQDMIDWYTLVLGMSTTHQFEGGTWRSNDAANHRLALLGHPAWQDDRAGRGGRGIAPLAYAGEFTPLEPLDLRLPQAVAS